MKITEKYLECIAEVYEMHYFEIWIRKLYGIDYLKFIWVEFSNIRNGTLQALRLKYKTYGNEIKDSVIIIEIKILI